MNGLLDNSVFTGAGALAIIATVVAFCRRYIVLLLRRFVVEVEVREWDMVMWLGLWLAHTDYGRRCRKLSTQVLQEGGTEAALFFEPGLGLHVFRYEGVWVLVDRRVEKEENVWNRREFYSIRVLGSRMVAEKLIEDAKTYGNEILARRHTAFISDGKGEWRRIPVGAPRELSSVVLPGTTVADIVHDVRTFLSRRAWYRERGIPWRRGYEFKGPPRTGKTSLVRAIANELQLPLYVLDLASPDLCDRDLIITLARVPAGAAVLIEDIDAVQRSRAGDGGATGQETPASKVTLSGLLNALDGPLTSEGRVLFVTTNHPERLDPALTGEGRLDVHVYFDYATADQARKIFLRFFPGRDDEADAFAAAIPDRAIPPAAIQEHLVARCDDPARAVAAAHLLARKDVRSVMRGTEAA